MEDDFTYVDAGHVYDPSARHQPKVQPFKWRLEPSNRADVDMTLITHRGNDQVTLHLTFEEVGRLALALTKARPHG